MLNSKPNGSTEHTTRKPADRYRMSETKQSDRMSDRENPLRSSPTAVSAISRGGRGPAVSRSSPISNSVVRRALTSPHHEEYNLTKRLFEIQKGGSRMCDYSFHGIRNR